MMRIAISFAAFAVLCACSGYEEEPVDAVTPSERQALDDAAEMIEQGRLPADAAPAANGAENEVTAKESGE